MSDSKKYGHKLADPPFVSATAPIANEIRAKCFVHYSAISNYIPWLRIVSPLPFCSKRPQR